MQPSNSQIRGGREIEAPSPSQRILPLPACSAAGQRLLCRRFWEGGGSLSARAGGGKSEHRRARCRVTQFFGTEIHAGDGTGRFLDGKCHRKQTAVRKRGKGEKVR